MAGQAGISHPSPLQVETGSFLQVPFSGKILLGDHSCLSCIMCSVAYNSQLELRIFNPPPKEVQILHPETHIKVQNSTGAEWV